MDEPSGRNRPPALRRTASALDRLVDHLRSQLEDLVSRSYVLASRARELQAEQEALREAQRRIVEELRDARVGPVEQQEIEEEVRFLDRRISAVRIKVAVVRDSAQKAAFLKAVERMEELRARARAAWEAVQASPGDEELAAELRASARAVRQHYAATQPEPDGPADVRYETVLSGCTADDRRDLRARWKELAASAAEAERRASGDSPAEREGSSTPGVHLHALYAPPVSLGEDSDSEDDGGQMADDADGESPPDPSDAGSSPLNAGPSPLHAGAMTSKLEQALAKLVLAAESGSDRLVVLSHDGLPIEAAALAATILRRIGSSPRCDEVVILDTAGHLSRAAPRSLLGGGKAHRHALGLPLAAPTPREVREALAPHTRSSDPGSVAAASAAPGGGQRFSAVAVDWVLAAGLASQGGAGAVLAAIDPAEPVLTEPGLVDAASLEATCGAGGGFALRVVSVDTTLPGGPRLSEALEGRAWLCLRLHSRLETLAVAGRSAAGALGSASLRASLAAATSASALEAPSSAQAWARVTAVERTRSGKVRRFHESIVVSLGTLSGDGGWLAELAGRSVDVDQDSERTAAAGAAAAAAAEGQVGAMQAAWASGRRRPAKQAAAGAGAGGKAGEMTSGSVRAVPRTTAPAGQAAGDQAAQGSAGQVGIRERSTGRDAVVLPFKASATNAGRIGAFGGGATQGIGTLAPRAAPSGLIQVDLGDDGGSGGSSDDSDSSGDDDDDEGMLV
ncbi:hypothetical protein FNF27_02339 [Cafeteria roenbergensis]|uniref:Uncharacterized protein n=1 Tax=Cafeteria roenbergensis TaxID=33653 RepID=A0A5A8EEG5_CAFRO|nr:hypothetical protein FNF27_02339 [Cafeteria roenbergensis]